TIAPNCTTQNRPGRPRYTKKPRKSMPAYPPSKMDVVSPTRVAAPCRLEEMAMAMMLVTGEMPSFSQMVRATGATMRTVATLSTKAEMSTEKRDREIMAHMTLGMRAINRSDSKDGILAAMNKETVPMVPAIIKITFQFMAKKTFR